MKAINYRNITKITSYPKQRYKAIKYDKPISILGYIIIKRGWYDIFDSIGIKQYKSISDLLKENTNLIFDNQFYYKPHLSIELCSGSMIHFFFDNIEDMEKEYIRIVELMK